MEEVQGEPIQEIGNDIDISNYEFESKDKSKELFSSNLWKNFSLQVANKNVWILGETTCASSTKGESIGLRWYIHYNTTTS